MITSITLDMLLRSHVAKKDDSFTLLSDSTGWYVKVSSGMTVYLDGKFAKMPHNDLLNCVSDLASLINREVLPDLSIDLNKLASLIYAKGGRALSGGYSFTTRGHIRCIESGGLTRYTIFHRTGNDRTLVDIEIPNTVSGLYGSEFLKVVDYLDSACRSISIFDSQYHTHNDTTYDLRIYGIHKEPNLLADMSKCIEDYFPDCEYELTDDDGVTTLSLGILDLVVTNKQHANLVKTYTCIELKDLIHPKRINERLRSSIMFVAYINNLVKYNKENKNV